jgi:putative transposase
VGALLMGIEPIVYTSEDESFPAPAFYRKAQGRLADLSRALDRKQKGSANRKDAKRLLALHHLKIANQRKEWHRELAAALTSRYPVLIVSALKPSLHIKTPIPKEDPNHPGEFLPNGACVAAEINKAILDNAWSQLVSYLKQAAERKGVRLIEVEQLPPTQMCSRCGASKPRPTADRLYTCGECGYEAEPNFNQVRCVLQAGLKLLRESPQAQA